MLAVFVSIFLFIVAFSQSALSVERPKQFVNLAFDGSKSLSMWQVTRDFAKENNIKFTYFISGVYFISDNDRRLYDGPGYKIGVSSIGFGKSVDEVQERLLEVDAAITEGHEIASHANGHFDGSGWTKNEWSEEFQQFHNLMTMSWARYDMPTPSYWDNYLANHMKGFRAPLLANNEGMYQTLKEEKFHYDTSKVRQMNYWPKKINGIWDFALAGLRMAYSGKLTLSMDYNIYVAQTQAKGLDYHDQRLENEVVATYLNYFKHNYYGNRAPLDIGHHFSLWNKGIYWNAMKRFAKIVCHMPEVVCGTYGDLVEFLEEKPASTLADYQNGDFTKASPLDFPLEDVLPLEDLSLLKYENSQLYSAKISDKDIEDLNKQVCPPEAHLEDSDEHFIENNTKSKFLPLLKRNY